jgi:hypothetical protein
LLLLGERIALLGRGEAALRRQAEPFQRNVLCRLLDAPFDVVLRLEPSTLRGNKPKHDNLLVAVEIAQRVETAGAIAVEFEKISVDVDLAEQFFGDDLIAA